MACPPSRPPKSPDLFPSAQAANPFEECGTHFHPARRPQWTSSAGSSLRALMSGVSHRSILFHELIATVFGDAGIPHPCLQDSATVLRIRARHCPERSKSRRMVCSKSSVTCGNLDDLRKTQDRLGLHTRLCAGFCTVVAAGAFEFENNL